MYGTTPGKLDEKRKIYDSALQTFQIIYIQCSHGPLYTLGPLYSAPFLTHLLTNLQVFGLKFEIYIGAIF
jgi:hypothetical protein